MPEFLCRFAMRFAARGAACLTALLVAGSAMAEPQPAQVGGRIDVRQIDPATLLFAVAEAVNINVVSTVPQADVPASFATDYASIDDLLRKLSNHVALRGVVLGRRILVLSPCLAGEVENLNPGSGGRFSVRLPDATVGEVVDAVGLTESGGGSEPEHAPRSSRVVARLVNVSRDDVLKSIAAAFGGTGSRPGARGNCTALEDEAASAAKRRARALREATPGCAERRDSESKSCQPLASYEVSQLISRGYIEGYGRRFGFVQAPDGLVHVVRPGMTVGKEGGRVLDVSRTEVTLSLSGPAAQAQGLVGLQHWAVPSGLSAP